MPRAILTMLFCLFIAVSAAAQGAKPMKPSEADTAKTVTLKAADGIKVFADIHVSPEGKTAPTILLFHQGGGDVRGEYERILPKLRSMGFNVIAADLRKGGKVFGGTNRTAQYVDQEKYGYCDAYPDLEAVLSFAEEVGFKGKRLAWGSSYSAALVIKLAKEHKGKIDGVLSFSPASGGPMAPCKPSLYLGDVDVPLLALRPGSEMKRESAVEQFKAFKAAGHKTYVSENGVHGSSMLDDSRVKGDVSSHWKAVKEFLKQFSSK